MLTLGQITGPFFQTTTHGFELTWAVLFWLSGPLYSCFAYSTVYARPTRPQWEPTRIIPFSSCAYAGPTPVKNDAAAYLFAYAVTLPAAFGNLEKELVLTWPQSYSNFWLCWSQAKRRVRLSLAWCFNVPEGVSGRFNASNMGWFAHELVVSLRTPNLRGAYAKSTQSLRLLQGSSGRNLVKHSAQARALWPL